MNRYIRLGYLLPRLVALIVLVAGLQYAAGWALRRAVIDSGQSVTGAKVEIDKSAVALLDTRVTMQGIRAADPRDPMRNLFEADVVEFDLDAEALLRRTAVAERGVVRGLRFGGERETSGELEESDLPTAEASDWFGAVDEEAARQLFAPWVNDLQANLTSRLADDLESVRLAEQLAEEWPERYQQLRRSAAELRTEAEAFEQSVNYARQNPLRHADFLRELPARATDLQQRLAELRAEIASMPSDAITDRERVAEAWRRDEQLLRDRLSADQLDPKSLTSALVGDRVTAAAGSLFDWVRWARKFVPASAPAEAAPARRGVDIRFAGVKQRPDLLVRSLDLSGVVNLSGRPMEFVGLVTDLTTQPAAHGEPTRVAIRTEGPTPLEAWATLDRSAKEAIDEIRVDCPSLALPRETLPLGEGLALEIAPSVARLNLTMRLEGERLMGDVRLVQDRMTLVTRTDEGAPSITRKLGVALSDSLQGVSNLDTTVSLAGTLDRPRIALRSNLGPEIAAAVQASFNSIAQEQVHKSLDGARQRIEARLGEIESVMAAATQNLPAELGGSAEFLQNLASGGGFQGYLPQGLQRFGRQVEQGGAFLR